MYGFHKVPHLQQGALHPDTDTEHWEFCNANFQRNQPDLLCLVTRKKGGRIEEDKDGVDINNIINDMAAIKRHQMTISADLNKIQQDNQLLWQESLVIRQRYQRQQETIDKILRFLASVFATKKKSIVPQKRPLLLEDERHGMYFINSFDRKGGAVDSFRTIYF
jgi:hypothetical protein